MEEVRKKRVGVIRGGAGEYYKSSLKKGGDVILHILENLNDKYKTVDILVDKNHIWHYGGIPITPSDLAHKIDVVWNVSHPSLSNILESLSIPNIGATSFLGILINNRNLLKEHIKSIGVSMPRYIIAPKSAREVFEKFGAPWIIKIYNEIKIAKTFNELAEMINGRGDVIVEEFIPGKIASVHSVSEFRGEDVYTFPLGNSFSVFTPEEKQNLINLVKNLHKHIGVKHYLKSDFILNPRGKVFLLGVESTPDFHKDSHFSQACESVGAKMHHIVEHILEKV